jgi:hypothetical protein
MLEDRLFVACRQLAVGADRWGILHLLRRRMPPSVLPSLRMQQKTSKFFPVIVVVLRSTTQTARPLPGSVPGTQGGSVTTTATGHATRTRSLIMKFLGGKPGRSQSRVALMPSERTRAQPALFTAALRGERMPGTRTDQAQICARAIGAAGPNASRPETSFGCRVIRTARASRSISHRRSAAGSPRRRLPNPGPAAHSQGFGG